MSNILVFGSGGREHALAHKLAESASVEKLIVSPGNGGTSQSNSTGISNNICKKISNSKAPCEDFVELAKWCISLDINMVVIGPEVPLANGIVNVLLENGVLAFGPSKEAATLECSKKFAKEFMVRHGIPTARFESFTNAEEACEHINNCDYPALVVKASGLAAGKGVIVCKTKKEACGAVHEILTENKFGSSGNILIVEELLVGEEFSVLCFTDGENIAVMPSVQDHKQVNDGDKGPNTGGMGAYGPCPQLADEILQYIKKYILQKTIDGMRKDGNKYIGVLYAGIMVTKDGPKVLEFNCRFGDPECQVILSLLKSDLYDIMRDCIKGQLNSHNIRWNENISSICVVLASKGYPGKYEKNKVITGIPDANILPGVKVFEAGTNMQEDGSKVTSGGRVLSVCATSETLELAAQRALKSIRCIQFEGCFYRKDIGHRGLEYINKKSSGLTYSSSGVNIQNGDELIRKISPIASQTSRKGCTVALGGFGGLFDLSEAGYKDPVLVSGTDGVGTKLLLAQEMGNHHTVGQDLVAMCVNDILTHNAEPLFFLDYFSCGKLESKFASQVIEGIVKGCIFAHCALIGGETAEMPGMYNGKHYDLAGFAVGAYDKNLHEPLPKLREILPGDVVIGLSSTGLHSNGFSLVRSVLKHASIQLSHPSPFDTSKQIGDSLLESTAIYSRHLLPVLRSNSSIRAAAHITGGGIQGNLVRVLPDDLCAILDAEMWNIQPVFGWLSKIGNIAPKEMLKTFNCGIGLCLIVSQDEADNTVNQCSAAFKDMNLSCSIIGKIQPLNPLHERIIINNFDSALYCSWFQKIDSENGQAPVMIPELVTVKPRVAIFISGTGTNMQALIDHSMLESSKYEVVLVLSNNHGATGLQKADTAKIPTVVRSHKVYSSREAYDREIHSILVKKNIQLICLAGFMRLLSDWFTHIWQGRILNIHPSLLPAFKGMHAHKKVLNAGVRVTGCTVHFVTKELDAGAIIAQTPVKVLLDDSIDTLSERVKIAEHQTYPQALEMVATGSVAFDPVKNCVKWRKISNGNN